jgi:hypothetical protein
LNELGARGNGRGMSTLEIVERYNFVAMLQQFGDRNTADVAGPTCYQHSH